MEPMLAAAFVLFSFSIFGGVFLLVFHIQDKHRARQSKSKQG
ncbi:MAG: hypothetical protein ABIF11_05785 [Nitrospirota bacterium]